MVMTHVQRGLDQDEAERRRARDGPNELLLHRRTPALVRAVRQLTHFFAVMLWVAGALAFAADLPELGVAIFVVIIVNGAFSFVEEARADRATEALTRMIPQRVWVRRGGQLAQVDARDVVTGDVVLLVAGDRVAADADVVESERLRLDMSMLTGESEPVSVGEGESVHAGTFVAVGEGVAVVSATGAHTRLGSLADLTERAVRPPSPLARELHRVVRTISLVAVGVGATFFVLSWVIGTELSDGFVFAVGVTVALVPEGLLPTVTLSLAIGAERMAERHALVRRLEAVETLGSTTYICTDKTGTLTENRMTVVASWAMPGVAARELTMAAARCALEGTDPMDRALVVHARRSGLDPDDDATGRPAREVRPFDPVSRLAAVRVDDGWLVVGAPESAASRTTDHSGAEILLATMRRMAAHGLRVVAVARADVGCDDLDDLQPLGLLGLEDPPRPSVPAAVTACRKAGIKLAMITGDHPATARAIGDQIGLCATDECRVVLGEELPEDLDALGELVDHDGVIISRATPEDKLRITEALQRRGHVVAMTGDGVNDGPALRLADIGIAMGAAGTDVAREAADLVLLDDDFATIVAAIELGRATFVNIRRFLTYHLTDNVAELTPFVVWALSGGRIPLALTVLQVLALDIGTDTLSAVALGAERPSSHLLDRPPVTGRLLDGTVARRAFGVLGPTEALFEMGAFFAVFMAAGWRPGDAFGEGAVLAAASGAAFTTVVLAQSANAFACRSSSRLPHELGWLTNPLLVAGIAIELVIAAAFLGVGPLADRLGHALPSAVGWLVALASAGAVLAVDALDKHLRGTRRRAGGGPTVSWVGWTARRAAER